MSKGLQKEPVLTILFNPYSYWNTENIAVYKQNLNSRKTVILCIPVYVLYKMCLPWWWTIKNVETHLVVLTVIT